MTRRRPMTLAALCGVLAVAAPAYAAAAGPDGPPQAASSTSKPSSGSVHPGPNRSEQPLSHPPSYTPPKNAPDAVTATAKVRIKPSDRFDVSLDPKGKKLRDKTWPDAADVFTSAELRQILPGLTSMTTSGCKHTSLPGGRTSAHNTVCVLTLQLKGEPKDIPSRIVVNVRGFGTAEQIGRPWDRELTAQRARAKTRPGLYTFYKNKAMGVASSYTDGTITRVLLTKGPVTGEIWFSGVGFTKLADDYLDSRKAYRKVIVPELITLLGDKMKGK